MARAILLLKYGEVTPLGGWFASQLTKVAAHSVEGFAADTVVPVPLHPSRLRERGYNQAELIARPLARLLGIPFRAYLLVRTRPRPDKGEAHSPGALGDGTWRLCYASQS